MEKKFGVKKSNIDPDCVKHRRSFARGMALFNYTEEAARSMAAVKYKNKREYLDFYAERSGKAEAV